MNRGLLILIFSSLCMSGSAAPTHHSWPATYDLTQTVRVEGEVFRFLYRNPHSVVQIMVENELGVIGQWDAEWGDLRILAAGRGVNHLETR